MIKIQQNPDKFNYKFANFVKTQQQKPANFNEKIKIRERCKGVQFSIMDSKNGATECIL